MSDDRPTTDSGGVPPSITELIRSYQERTGDSLHRVSDRSRELTGHRVSQRYLWDLQRGEAKGWPKNPHTFSSLAAGLGVTELAVVLGFAREFSIPVRVPVFASRLPAEADTLDEHVQVALLSLVRALAVGGGAEHRLADDVIPDVSGVEGMIEGPIDGDVSDRGQSGQA